MSADNDLFRTESLESRGGGVPCTVQSTLPLPTLEGDGSWRDDATCDAPGTWGYLHRTVGACKDSYLLCDATTYAAGRNRTSTIVLNDARVSNTHFTLEKGDADVSENIVITDTSTNGTFVNDHRLIKHRPHRLHNGDVIGAVPVGRGYVFAFVFRIPGTAMRQPTVLPPRHPVNAPITWQKGDLIGRGGYGEVYLGINCETSELIAVKTIELSQSESHSVQQEIRLLQRLRHPNIVRYLGSREEESHTKLHIIMEYVPGGSLASLIERFGRFHEVVVSNYCVQILQGLQYLHDSMVVHRDIKAANILVSEAGLAKLSDFGSALTLANKKSAGTTVNMLSGTPLWMAPETIGSSVVSFASDIWSVGCVVLEMCTAKQPWSELSFDNPLAALYHIGRCTAPPQFPANASPDLASFLVECFRIAPHKRPTCAGLQGHQFLRRVPNEGTFTGGQHRMESLVTPKKRKGADGMPLQHQEAPPDATERPLDMDADVDMDMVTMSEGKLSPDRKASPSRSPPPAPTPSVLERSVSCHTGFLRKNQHQLVGSIVRLRSFAGSSQPPGTPEHTPSRKRPRDATSPGDRRTGITQDFGALGTQ